MNQIRISFTECGVSEAKVRCDNQAIGHGLASSGEFGLEIAHTMPAKRAIRASIGNCNAEVDLYR